MGLEVRSGQIVTRTCAVRRLTALAKCFGKFALDDHYKVIKRKESIDIRPFGSTSLVEKRSVLELEPQSPVTFEKLPSLRQFSYSVEGSEADSVGMPSQRAPN